MEDVIKMIENRLIKLRLILEIPYMNNGNYFMTNAKIVELEELLSELKMFDSKNL